MSCFTKTQDGYSVTVTWSKNRRQSKQTTFPIPHAVRIFQFMVQTISTNSIFTDRTIPAGFGRRHCKILRTSWKTPWKTSTRAWICLVPKRLLQKGEKRWVIHTKWANGPQINTVNSQMGSLWNWAAQSGTIFRPLIKVKIHILLNTLTTISYFRVSAATNAAQNGANARELTSNHNWANERTAYHYIQLTKFQQDRMTYLRTGIKSLSMLQREFFGTFTYNIKTTQKKFLYLNFRTKSRGSRCSQRGKV